MEGSTRERYRDWLVSLSTADVRKLVDARRDYDRELTYQLTLTPTLHEELRRVTLLNRRMLDRSPEHVELNEFLSKLHKMCTQQADENWDAHWPADVPRPPDDANPYKKL